MKKSYRITSKFGVVFGIITFISGIILIATSDTISGISGSIVGAFIVSLSVKKNIADEVNDITEKDSEKGTI